jgi:hypothetical protein
VLRPAVQLARRVHQLPGRPHLPGGARALSTVVSKQTKKDGITIGPLDIDTQGVQAYLLPALRFFCFIHFGVGFLAVLYLLLRH